MRLRERESLCLGVCAGERERDRECVFVFVFVFVRVSAAGRVVGVRAAQMYEQLHLSLRS